MRIRKISVDGYGRFTGLSLEFAPGLQVIIGPNEQGKSTIRGFVSDMLYGQKRSVSQRAYEEGNELRLPWTNPDCYGGTLQYVLDRGQEIEVIRNFDRKRESIQVYDRTHAREITSDFELLRNREVDFASEHLGLTKDVFAGIATIGHFSLDGLGDRDALNQIREKLQTLADSADESNSAEAALKILKNRVLEIGSSNARTKPLPAARGRLQELNSEYAAARALQEELESICEKRQELGQQIAALREQRLAREEELRVLEAHALGERLQQAEALQGRVNQATQQCFALGAVRDFPHDRASEVTRMETQIGTARMQLQRTKKENEQILTQLREERRRMGAEGAPALQEVPEEAETRLATLTTSLQHLRERFTETENLVTAARNRLRDAQVAVASLPDFSRVASDPVEWITTLASSFGVALRARDDEMKALAQLQAEVAQKRAATRDHDELFRPCQDFQEQAREHELGKRVHQDHIAQRHSTLQTLQLAEEEVAGDLPGFQFVLAICTLFILVLAGAFVGTGSTNILYPGALVVIATLYFVMRIGDAKVRLRRIQQQTEETRGELDRLERVAAGEPGLIEKMMEQAGCETLRELEAHFDHYRVAMAELQAREDALASQEERAAEAEERVEKMMVRLRASYVELGDSIEDEYDVQEATGRVISRYQEYRESKRRVADSRSVLERHEAELKRLTGLIEKAAQELDKAEEDARTFLRENGFTEEPQFPSVAAAFRAYRTKTDGRRAQRARVDLLQETAQSQERQVKAEAFDLEKHEQQLAHFLAKAGVSSLQQWHDAASKARQYQEIWNRRTALEEQLAAVLHGQDLKQLRDIVKEQGALPPPSGRSAEHIKADLAALSRRIDDIMKEEHALHILMAQRSSGMRSLNEIEEEKELVERQVRELEMEFEATTYAMALIEEMARDKHARIAPRLAGAASRYFSAITDGAYNELLISRDLTISVRIPQTNRLEESPEKSLSKGTVDQLYLALRLAFVQAMSDSAESIPMLLDDPFANYDDARLERTLRLLGEIGQAHQILLFTCREDVARAAEAMNAPLIRLDSLPVMAQPRLEAGGAR